MPESNELFWTYLGRADYGAVLGIQRALRERVIAGIAPGGLLLLEHPPTITLGRHGEKKNVLASAESLAAAGIAQYHIERGGDVTYHGPGQLVAYPVLRVTGGVRRFVEALGEAARAVLADRGIEARWSEERPGLWTARGKIAAVGLHIHRGVAIHGLALNVSPDLGHYQHIVPCGLPDGAVTSIQALRGNAPTVAEVAAAFADRYAPPGPRRFQRQLPPDVFFSQMGLQNSLSFGADT